MKIDNNTPASPSPTFGMSMKKPKGEDLKKMKAYFRRELAITPFHKIAYQEFCYKQRKNKFYDIYFKSGVHEGLINSNDCFIVAPKKDVPGKPIDVPCVSSKYGPKMDRIIVYRNDKYQRFLEAHPKIEKNKILKTLAEVPCVLEDFVTIARTLIFKPENLLPDSLRQASKIAKNMERLTKHFID